MRASLERGGIYIERALKDIEDEMIKAFRELEDALFKEYWGVIVPKKDRINYWLALADTYAVGWKPSESLFLNADF